MMRTAPGGGRRPVSFRWQYWFPGGVGLGGQALGAVGLHQHKVRGVLPAGEVRGGQLALRVIGPGADDGAVGKAITQLRCGGGEGTPVRAHDAGGGGHQHRAAVGQFLCQHAQQGGLAAAADHRGQAGTNPQQFP